MRQVSFEALKRENSSVWVLLLVTFALPLFVIVGVVVAKNEQGYCSQVRLVNRYESLGDCIKANPGKPLTACNYDPSPLLGNYIGPLYKNPICGKPRHEGEERDRFDVPRELPYLAVSIEPMRRCGRLEGSWCSAYTRHGEHYPESLTQ